MQATQPGSARSPGAVHAVQETDEIVALCLEGDFDMTNTPAFVAQIDHALIMENKHLIIDLSQATFIDSAVINALFHAARRAKTNDRTVVLQLGAAPIVERAIEITKIDQVLSRVSARPDAVETIRSSHRPSRSPRWGISHVRSSPMTTGGKAERQAS